MLVRDYQPKRIYQWGSLLHPQHFQEISDIDIAVEGLTDPMDGLHALDDACQLTRFPVDLVELERMDALLLRVHRLTDNLSQELQTFRHFLSQLMNPHDK